MTSSGEVVGLGRRVGAGPVTAKSPGMEEAGVIVLHSGRTRGRIVRDVFRGGDDPDPA